MIIFLFISNTEIRISCGNKRARSHSFKLFDGAFGWGDHVNQVNRGERHNVTAHVMH